VGGDFHGSISTKDKLIVGERAQIHANIKAGKIEVYGAIFGNVESARRLHLHSGGSIVGDIRTPELVIEAGGMFDGKTTRPNSHWKPLDHSEGNGRGASGPRQI